MASHAFRVNVKANAQAHNITRVRVAANCPLSPHVVYSEYRVIQLDK